MKAFSTCERIRALFSRAGVRDSAGVRCALASLLWLLSPCVSAADLSVPDGLWQALDASGKPEGVIRVYQDHGAYFGRMEPDSSSEDKSRRCTRCTDERRDQPFDGLIIIRNMRLDGGEYAGGDVLDPDTGKVYGCTFKLTDGGHRMVMRGFFGVSLLGRSQIWQRVAAPPQ